MFAGISTGYVIKQLVHAFSCAYIEIWMHAGSLESTQEARVAFGCASSNSYASLVLSKLPACIHNSMYAQLSMNQLLNNCRMSNLFLTECEGRTGEYRQGGPRAARSVQKRQRANIPQYGPEQVKLVSSLLFGIGIIFRTKQHFR